jgi:hypothetical protein
VSTPAGELSPKEALESLADDLGLSDTLGIRTLT